MSMYSSNNPLNPSKDQMLAQLRRTCGEEWLRSNFELTDAIEDLAGRQGDPDQRQPDFCSAMLALCTATDRTILGSSACAIERLLPEGEYRIEFWERLRDSGPILKDLLTAPLELYRSHVNHPYPASLKDLFAVFLTSDVRQAQEHFVSCLKQCGSDEVIFILAELAAADGAALRQAARDALGLDKMTMESVPARLVLWYNSRGPARRSHRTAIENFLGQGAAEKLLHAAQDAIWNPELHYGGATRAFIPHWLDCRESPVVRSPVEAFLLQRTVSMAVAVLEEVPTKVIDAFCAFARALPSEGRSFLRENDFVTRISATGLTKCIETVSGASTAAEIEREVMDWKDYVHKLDETRIALRTLNLCRALVVLDMAEQISPQWIDSAAAVAIGQIPTSVTTREVAQRFIFSESKYANAALNFAAVCFSSSDAGKYAERLTQFFDRFLEIWGEESRDTRAFSGLVELCKVLRNNSITGSDDTFAVLSARFWLRLAGSDQERGAFAVDLLTATSTAAAEVGCETLRTLRWSDNTGQQMLAAFLGGDYSRKSLILRERSLYGERSFQGWQSAVPALVEYANQWRPEFGVCELNSAFWLLCQFEDEPALQGLDLQCLLPVLQAHELNSAENREALESAIHLIPWACRGSPAKLDYLLSGELPLFESEKLKFALVRAIGGLDELSIKTHAYLQGALSDSDVALRAEAADALTEMLETPAEAAIRDRATEYLLWMLNADESLRAIGAWIAGNDLHMRASVRDRLLFMAKTDPDAKVRALAIESFAKQDVGLESFVEHVRLIVDEAAARAEGRRDAAPAPAPDDQPVVFSAIWTLAERGTGNAAVRRSLSRLAAANCEFSYDAQLIVNTWSKLAAF